MTPAGEESVKKSIKKDEKTIRIYDVQKVPVSQLSHILDRTLRVSRMLQAKYVSAEQFDKDLKEKVKFDQHGNVEAQHLENYLIDVCKDQLTKRELNRNDLEGFLSSLVYNKYKTTDGNALAQFVFSNDIEISKKIHSVQRPMPPPAEASGAYSLNSSPNPESPTAAAKVSDERMRDIIKELQLKSFADKKLIYQIFKDYDRDGDGYVSYSDIKEQFKNLKIPVNESETRKFIELIDSSKKGYLDFRNFASVVTQNMAEQLVPLPNDSETYLYKRDRINVIPNGDKARENIMYHTTFNSKFAELRDKLLPDKNLLLSIFHYNYA